MQESRVRLNILASNGPAMEALALPDGPFLPLDVPLIDRNSLCLDQRTTLRTSSYTIYVDLPGEPEQMLLVHGYTGAFDKVSRRVATYVRSLESKRPPKPLYGDWTAEAPSAGTVIPPSDQTIQILERRGYLTAMTEQEEQAFFTKLAAQIHHKATRRAPSYILVPTYQCNLRCAYCFQDHMRTDASYRHLLRIMDREMVDRIFVGMQHIERAHGSEPGAEIHRNILLFGGEPLLEESRSIIEYILEKGFERGTATFSAVSNATDLHAFHDLLGPSGISWIQVTIDGPPKEHDERRIYADGAGSYDRIAKNIDMALERGVRISVRMNIDRTNIDRLPAAAEEFIRRGWDQHPHFSSYVAPVDAANAQTDVASVMNSWQLNQAFNKMKAAHPSLARIGCNDNRILHRARAVFDKRLDPLPTFRADFCSAHTTMYILDAFGDLYACWERLGDPSLRIGYLDPSGQVFMNRAQLENWRSRSVVSNPVCRKCRYATHCGGGCAVLAEKDQGDIHANHCDGFAKRFRASVAQAYQEFTAGVQHVPQADSVCDL